MLSAQREGGGGQGALEGTLGKTLSGDFGHPGSEETRSYGFDTLQSCPGQAAGFAFPMQYKTGPTPALSDTWTAKRGSGYITIYDTTYVAGMVAFMLAYGHGGVGVSGVSITNGWPSLTFSSGVSTTATDILQIDLATGQTD